jgi:hypothetical protein
MRDRPPPVRPRESENGDPVFVGKCLNLGLRRHFAKGLGSRWSLPPTPIGGGNERMWRFHRTLEGGIE